MSTWNKVLLGLIIVASLGFLYLAMVALATHRYWRESAEKHEERIEALAAETEKLHEKGLPDGRGGLKELELGLNKYSIGRGRVWYGCSPQKADAQSGAAAVAVDRPDPHGITEKMILYVFEETGVKEGGRFLGEFKVTQVAPKQVALEPSMRMLPGEVQRIAQSRGPWTLRERLPADKRDMFAGYTPEQLAKLLPNEKAVDEYAKAAKGELERVLRDYRQLLKTFDRQRTELIERDQRAQRHLAMVQSSLADTQKLIQEQQSELTVLTANLDEMKRQRDAAVAHLDRLKKELAERTERIEALLAKNREVAAQIAQLQGEAARRVNEQTAIAQH